VLITGTLLWTFAEITGAPTVFSHPGRTAPEHLRGRYIGAMQSVFGLGTAVGPVLGILLWGHVGQAVWLWTALVAALATVAAQVAIGGPARAAEPATPVSGEPTEPATGPAPVEPTDPGAAADLAPAPGQIPEPAN